MVELIMVNGMCVQLFNFTEVSFVKERSQNLPIML